MSIRADKRRRLSVLRRVVHEKVVRVERGYPEWGDLKWLADNGYARITRVTYEIEPTDRGRRTAEE
jgi:hypothetical protein